MFENVQIVHFHRFLDIKIAPGEIVKNILLNLGNFPKFPQLVCTRCDHLQTRTPIFLNSFNFVKKQFINLPDNILKTKFLPAPTRKKQRKMYWLSASGVMSYSVGKLSFCLWWAGESTNLVKSQNILMRCFAPSSFTRRLRLADNNRGYIKITVARCSEIVPFGWKNAADGYRGRLFHLRSLQITE